MADKSGNLMATENAAESPYAEGVVGSIAPSMLIFDDGPAADDSTPKHKARKPTIEQIKKWAKADKAYWEPRNVRMLRHQNRVLMKRKPIQGDKPDTRIYLNDCKVLIEKIASMIARRSPRIEVPPKGEANYDAAQRIENALRWWTEYLNRQWQEGLHNPLPYDQGQSILLRGWVCERLLLNSDDEGWVDDTLFDPMNLYPRVSGKRITRVNHIYQSTVGELIEEFPDAEDRFAGQDEDKKVSCIDFYQNREPFYHAVIADGEWAKEPTELGYWPWIIAVAKGAFSHHEYPGGDADDVTANIGAGFLDAIEYIVDALQQFLSMLTAAAAKQENPPIGIWTNTEGDIRQVEIGAGDTSHLVTGDKVEVFEIGAKVGTLMPIISTLQDRANKAGLPSPMFGQGGELASGYMGALMMGAAEDTVWAFIKALQGFQSRRYEKMLQIYAKFADKGIPILSPSTAESKVLQKGKMVWGEELSVADIEANGTYVDVVYEDFSPQDRVALGNLAIMLVREKLVDLATARDKYLGLDDPGLINDKVLADMAYLSQDVVQARTKIELAKREMWPELMALLQAEVTKDKSEAEAKAMAQQIAQNGGRPPGAGPGAGGPGTAEPGPIGGLPTTAASSMAMGMTPAVPSDEEINARLMAGAGG
ncbi:MAG: hypothetical protein Q7O66_07350 [Dehalococcoidia bacterium]|nr:hypothetical protein [Dehalococcoidia bacterium]